jgi:aminopeptidase N
MILALGVVLATAVGADTPSPPTLRLPAGPRPTLYELELRVVPTEPTFTGEARIHLELNEATSLLWLNATGLEIASATLEEGGNRLAARTIRMPEDFLGFAFERPVGPGKAVLHVSYSGPIDDLRSRGLYRVQEPDGEWYAYTLFEPIDARRVFPCFDEPSHKVPWRLRLRVRETDTALANAPVESVHGAGGGLKLVSFAQSKPMPSYLVAFVVGPFEVVDSGTAGRERIRVRFVVPRGRSEELRYAREVTPKVVELLEGYFEMPYPFEKLDVAVLPRWNAMEHPGLVAMGQSLTLIRPAEETASRRRDYANILIHELAHYWFGDYVTHAWWDDIWLNEALATWLDTKLTPLLDPSWRYGEWAKRFLGWAKQTDALASARRIREPIRTRSDIESSFDGSTTYTKGATVLEMLEGWIGEPTMRAGVRRYLAAHAWGNATFADFAARLEEASGRDVTPLLGSFLDQPGLPVVTAALDCGGRTARLELHQERFVTLAGAAAAERPWNIPVCVRWPAGADVRRQCVLLDSLERTLELEGGGCPAWVVVNDSDRGYYRVAYDERLRGAALAGLAEGGRSALAPVERMALLDDLDALARSGRVPLAAALAALPPALQDPDPFVAADALDLANLLQPARLPVELRESYARMLQRLAGGRARELGWNPGTDPPDKRQLRERLVPHVAVYGRDEALRAEARRLALAWLDDRRAVDADLAVSLLEAAAASGERSVYDRILAEARRTTDRDEQQKLLWALGRFRDPALSADALRLVSRDEWSPQESIAVLWAELARPEAEDQAWTFLKEHFDALQRKATDTQSAWLIGGTVARFCDETKRDDAAAFFGSRVAKIDGAALALANGLETAEACIAQARRDAPAIAAFLRGQ